jgi:hypothetical protein
MKEKMTTHEVMRFVHASFAEQALAAQEIGVPLGIISGELMKLAIKMAIHAVGKEAAEREVQNFVNRYFETISSEEEAIIRRKGTELEH